jgi:uncharacterized protein DUF6788
MNSKEGSMTETLEDLERKRAQLYRKLSLVGDFRRGTVSERYRRCGKKNCACARPGHPGHGPHYQWSTTTKGNKSLSRNLELGVDLEKALSEHTNYREFLELTEELIEVNERICRLRPLRQIDSERELEELKKKLRRKFSSKRRGK